MSDLVDKIRSRAAWDVSIRPAGFVPDRIRYEDLKQILDKSVVRLRGWPVPMIDPNTPLQRGADWIGQEIEAGIVWHYEAWRFFRSGQFSHLVSVSADWRAGTNEATPVPDGADAVIEVWEILFRLTEVFELAARLVLKMPGTDEMTVSARLEGIQNRALVIGQPGRVPFMQLLTATMPSFEQSITLPRDVLIAEARSQAAELSRQFLLRFGWEASLEQLLDHQRELANLA
jgi:hypothetical protein